MNRVVTTDALGDPGDRARVQRQRLSDAGKSGYDQRQMQLGVKFSF